jgi:hypothetical protein
MRQDSEDDYSPKPGFGTSQDPDLFSGFEDAHSAATDRNQVCVAAAGK